MDHTILTNFNVPAHIRQRFDAVCHASGRTRTSVLVEMMERYVIDQSKALACKARQLGDADRIIEENRALSRPNDDWGEVPGSSLYGSQTRAKSIFEPDSPFMDDGLEGWS
jgi:hypothetical protein